VNSHPSPLERLFHAVSSTQGVDDLLRAVIALFVEVSGTDVGVIRVADRDGLCSRASVGLDEEVDAGFTSPFETLEERATVTKLLRLPVEDQRVSQFMRHACVRAAYWFSLPHDTLRLGACLGSRNTEDIPVERAAVLEVLGTHAAHAIARLHAFETLEEALRQRDQILADIAHDLKNSINAVALSATVLDQRLEPFSPHRATIDRIARNTHRAASVVESLLSSSVIEAGRLVLRQGALEPAELVLSAAETQQDAGVGAGVVIATDLTPGLPPVRGDRERLLEVFDNLVGNALKFTKANGSITVGAAPRGDHVLFWVRDTGTGIPPEQLTHVFERYWRAKPGDRRGTGLGLSICKGIIEAHGGRIWAESTPGRGTTMLFSLPVVEARPAIESDIAVNVLLVDDRPENLHALDAILDGQGYRTITAVTGQEALHVALQEELSVVLLDVEMPDMNGFEIARHLKLVKRTKSIPIIFITAHGDDPEQIHRAYAAGGADYLVKPLDPEIVRRKVAVLVELGRRRAPHDSRPPTA
jgi:signal transduction histidine kinase/CheY-like chemotaxis protein